ncbi:MAG: DHH family phosphoesterase [Caldilineaceae bacterium]|nr:DHH family phosphoesterase [Caldilineaceae bacterium]
MIDLQEVHLSAVIDAVRANQRFLCISHVAPDGDAVGSLLGMGEILTMLGKEATLALADGVPDNLTFLPGTERVVSADGVGDVYDCVIVLDVSSPDRMGNVYREDAHGKSPLVVIDHHVTNTYFGDVDWVEPRCAAVCQMLVYLAQRLGVSLRGNLAEDLLTGLVTDTLCFRTSNTTADVLGAATVLMENGAQLSAITARTLNNKPFRSLKLWGEVLPGARLAERVLWVTVAPEQLAAAQATAGDLELSSVLSAVAEADISATFIQKTDERKAPVVECSFRAKPGFNVSDTAFALGGGGHPAAAGCTVPGTLEKAVPPIVAQLQQARAQQATGQ